MTLTTIQTIATLITPIIMPASAPVERAMLLVCVSGEGGGGGCDVKIFYELACQTPSGQL